MTKIVSAEQDQQCSGDRTQQKQACHHTAEDGCKLLLLILLFHIGCLRF